MNNIDDIRRRIITSLPFWGAPIITSVILPAHAQTSRNMVSDGVTGNTLLDNGNSNSGVVVGSNNIVTGPGNNVIAGGDDSFVIRGSINTVTNNSAGSVAGVQNTLEAVSVDIGVLDTAVSNSIND